MVWWIFRSIPHRKLIELFLLPASPLVTNALGWDKIKYPLLVDHESGFLLLSIVSFTFLTPYNCKWDVLSVFNFLPSFHYRYCLALQAPPRMIWLETDSHEWVTFLLSYNVERDVAHGAMGRRIDSSWWTHRAISRSSQCSTTGVAKAVVCVIQSVGWCI